MVDIRPNVLPDAILPLRSGDALIVDQGADGVRQTNPFSMTDSVAPVATQSEAVAGADNVKRMTPLRTKQSIASEVGVSLASNTQGAKADSAVQSVNGKTGNSVTLVKGDVGLGNVDNTSDLDKPISTATQTALSLKANDSVVVKSVNGVLPVSGNVTVAAEEKRLQDTRTTAIAESFASNILFVETAGYSSVGDGGGALYKRVSSEPSHAGKFQSADGAWWEISGPFNIKQFGAKGDGVTDDTAAIQAAIDALPDLIGGAIMIPAGDFYVSSLKVQGTAGNKVHVSILGAGESSRIIQIGGQGAIDSVVNIKAGNGHRISGVTIIGDYGRGTEPVRGTGFWNYSTAYLVGDTVQTKADGSYALDNFNVSPWLQDNKVWRCTVAHTSAASGTIDTSKFVEITDGSIQNQYYTDASYNTRHCIHVDTCFDVEVTNCVLQSAVYAAINIGPGALGPDFMTSGASRIVFSNNIVRDCENGTSGGRQSKVVIAGNLFVGMRKLGIQVDYEAFDCVVSGNNVTGSTGGQTGIWLYGVYNSVVVGNTVAGPFELGIAVANSSYSCSVAGNTVRGVDKGIIIEGSSNDVSVSGNSIYFCLFYGIWVRDSCQRVSIDGNALNSCAQGGVLVESSHLIQINSGSVTSCGGFGGIRFVGSDYCSVSGAKIFNNGDAADTDSSGIRFENSSFWLVNHVTATDTRGSKTQRYGVRSMGSSTGGQLGVNYLIGNLTGDYLLENSNTKVSMVAA